MTSGEDGRRWALEDFEMWEAITQPRSSLRQFFQDALRHECCICIPPDASLDGEQPSDEFVARHLLVPDPCIPDTFFPFYRDASCSLWGEKKHSGLRGLLQRFSSSRHRSPSQVMRSPSMSVLDASDGGASTSAASASESVRSTHCRSLSADPNTTGDRLELVDTPYRAFRATGPSFRDYPDGRLFRVLYEEAIRSQDGVAKVVILREPLWRRHPRSDSGRTTTPTTTTTTTTPAMSPDAGRCSGPDSHRGIPSPMPEFVSPTTPGPAGSDHHTDTMDALSGMPEPSIATRLARTTSGKALVLGTFGDSPEDNVLSATDLLFKLDSPEEDRMGRMNQALQAFRGDYEPIAGYESDLFDKVKALVAEEMVRWTHAVGGFAVSKRRTERSVMLAVHTYAHARLYQFVFPAVCAIELDATVAFERGAEALRAPEVDLASLDVSPVVASHISMNDMRLAFARFNVSTNPFDKLQVACTAIRTVTRLVQSACDAAGDAGGVGADALVPVLAFALARFPPRDTAAQIAYVEMFLADEALSGGDEEREYAMVTFRAAVLFISNYPNGAERPVEDDDDDENDEEAQSDASSSDG